MSSASNFTLSDAHSALRTINVLCGDDGRISAVSLSKIEERSGFVVLPDYPIAMLLSMGLMKLQAERLMADECWPFVACELHNCLYASDMRCGQLPVSHIPSLHLTEARTELEKLCTRPVQRDLHQYICLNERIMSLVSNRPMDAGLFSLDSRDS